MIILLIGFVISVFCPTWEIQQVIKRPVGKGRNLVLCSLYRMVWHPILYIFTLYRFVSLTPWLDSIVTCNLQWEYIHIYIQWYFHRSQHFINTNTCTSVCCKLRPQVISYFVFFKKLCILRFQISTVHS